MGHPPTQWRLAATLLLASQAQGVTFTANAFTGAGSSGSGQPRATSTDMTIASITGGSTEVGALGTLALASGKVLHRYNGWLTEDGEPRFRINSSTPVRSFSLTVAGLGGTPPPRALNAYFDAALAAEAAFAGCASRAIRSSR